MLAPETMSVNPARFGMKRILLNSILLALATSAPAQLGPDGWTNSTGGLWRVATNWSAGQAPNSTFPLILITNANTKTVTIDASTLSTNLSVQKLTVSAPAGSTNTLALVNLTTNLPLQLSSTLTVDRGGVLNLTNAALISVGVALDHGGTLNLTNALLSASGALTTFDVINGRGWLDSGRMDCGSIQAVRLGRTNNGLGSLTVAGGTALAPQVPVG